jgi:hypothetical protein
MYSITDGRMTRVPRRKAVILVADEDDTSLDIKIRALREYLNIKVADKIMFTRSSRTAQATARVGTSKVVCNPHHTDEILRTVGVTTNNLHNPESISLVVVVQTTSCYLNSINGLVECVRYYNLPVQIEMRKTSLGTSWMMERKENLLIKYRIVNQNKITVNEPITKRRWQQAVGYTIYIPTEKGPKLLEKKKKLQPNVFQRLIGSLVTMLIKTLKRALSFVLRKAKQKWNENVNPNNKDSKDVQSEDKRKGKPKVK